MENKLCLNYSQVNPFAANYEHTRNYESHKIFACFLLHLHEILCRMVYNLMVSETRFSLQDPLIAKLSMKFQGIDFSTEKSSAVNVLRRFLKNILLWFVCTSSENNPKV